MDDLKAARDRFLARARSAARKGLPAAWVQALVWNANRCYAVSPRQVANVQRILDARREVA
jgi:hypothetical protein